MNRLAIVLAADSATTVSHWENGKEHQRYFKGANKIFQLSNFHPVGIMIFDSASLLDVPWEVVVKEFRQDLGDAAFNTVEGYADAFFTFLQSNDLLFPRDIRRKRFIDGVAMAALRTIGAANALVPAGDPTPDQTTASALASRQASVDALPFPTCSDVAKLNAASAAHKADIVADVQKTVADFGVTFHGSIDLVVDIALMDVMKSPASVLRTTGIVFAGFGTRDVFPVALEYQSCCYLNEDHAALKKAEHKIDHTTPARLLPFAQASMAETFRMGMGQSAFISMLGAVTAETGSLVADAVVASGGAACEYPGPGRHAGAVA